MAGNSPSPLGETTLRSIREDKNAIYQEEGIGEGLLSDVEPQSEDAFETDSSSKSDILDAEKKEEEEEEEEEEVNVSGDARPGLGLKDMADYWRNLAVPDAISTASPQARIEENEQVQPDWSLILSDGESRPNLDIQRSQNIAPNIQRTWDVDSVISWASCLSVNRGLYVSYHPPTSRNFRSSIYVFHQGTALHLIPHLRLGSGRQSPTKYSSRERAKLPVGGYMGWPVKMRDGVRG
ncbi:hypothetical protein B0J15DRAFT_577575 [Fusarium solani]|uniref:Uncharacterized protein n=1 Tax=Fusarium solani TaxID=169388 RepID=A0A9P9FZC9_FUSSL|nr:uncharacterized protein B0J15DRAFT_577575 [Fusarium solani]KAH7227249.1 hypothetical protein B0J15DRAFT_577575 [Fusarium solani]